MKTKKVNRLYEVKLQIAKYPTYYHPTLYSKGELYEGHAFKKKEYPYALVIGGVWAKSKNDVKQKVDKFISKVPGYLIFYWDSITDSIAERLVLVRSIYSWLSAV